MSTFEMIVTGVMAYSFAFHTVVMLMGALGPINHPATDWCRRVMFVAPTRRMLELWQDIGTPIAYLAVAAMLFHFGWKAAAVFTFLGAVACVTRTLLMRVNPARNYRPKQLHPLCQWM
jgi:predicted membrane-bound spermidine synthase